MSINQDMAWVSGFFDPELSDPELRERIEVAIAEQRAADELARDAPPAEPVLSATPPGSVAVQWSRIAEWMGENLPAVPIVGADPDRIARAEAATGVKWPAELIELFEDVNGLPLDSSAPILPGHGFFDLDRMLGERQMMLDVASRLDDGWLREEAVGSQAGDTAGMILPEFIPIAGLDNYYLFVDTRPGELSGCVTEFADEGADGSGPRWLSISAMLADLANSLETGEVFAWGMKPMIVDGMLEWRYEP
ncbi:SMI1/KNR4 family protein [Tomitella biformata]|uniref:SMI1/KNR4 family protein n=1 Tax=Tomitella biformata TaxID=630403 RepID=UPI000465D7B4|nr:SMI1/KNR4 family protein [Tomitella biformata]